MANFPIIGAASFAWGFRGFLAVFLVLTTWSLFFPDRYRDWNLRMYGRYRWLASARLREKMRAASMTRLRIQSGVILIYAVIMLLVSFKVLR